MIETSDRRFPDRQVGSNHEPFACVITRYGEPLDLSAAIVTFTIRNKATSAKPIDGAAATGDAEGNFAYTPTITEVATAGEYQGQIRLEFPDDTQTYTLLIDLRILANL